MADIQKTDRNAYMREYNRKNKKKVYAQRRQRMRERIENGEIDLDAVRKYKREWKRENADRLNAAAKERNWDYDPEKAKVKRARYYHKHPATNVLRQAKARAAKKGLPYELTNEWYWKEFEKDCIKTGIPFDPSGSDTPWVAHIDRIEPAKGYTVENSRLVCACYNLAKKHWTDADVMIMAKALVSTIDE